MKKTSGGFAIFFTVLAGLLICLSFCGFTIETKSDRPTVSLVYHTQTFTYVDEHIEPTDFTVKEEFEKRKINAPISEKTDLVCKLISGGAEVKDAMLYCFPRLRKVVDEAVGKIKAAARESKIAFYPDRRPMFNITKSAVGYYLDEERVYSDILFAFAKNVTRVTLAPKIVQPQVHERELIPMTELRSSFTTAYTKSDDSRKHNIKLALSKINGLRLGSGEVFSFNSIVGKRSEANGFKTAKIILEGQYVEGVGGGVCQASTTVYNCALLGEMTILSANHHSLIPSYVKPSFDAMVNSSSSDLKFRNDTEGPVFFRTFCTDDELTVEMYSAKLPYKIKTESVILFQGEFPPEIEFVDTERKYTEGMEPGSKVRVSGGSIALKSEGYLNYIYPNGTTKRIKIRTDTYAATNPRIAVAP